MEYHKLTPQQKIERLTSERATLQEKFDKLFRTFRGVIHEDSSSEMKYTMIKVLEAHIHSIDEELKILHATVDASE